MLSFYELVQTLLVNPSEHESRVEEIKTIFINMYFLINLHRAKQARFYLSEVLKFQIEDKKKKIEKLNTLVIRNSFYRS